MIAAFYSPGVDVSRLRCGPLKPHIDDFAGHLARLGYSTQAGRGKIRLVADSSRWLERRQRACGSGSLPRSRGRFGRSEEPWRTRFGHNVDG